jgi:hypothetical protein
MEYAPIALFVYNRTQHLMKTIAALKTNTLALSSRLIIFSDGPKSDKQLNNVKDVRKYIRTIKGFKSVEIVERDINWGLSKSIICGLTQTCNHYGKVIVLEDDIMTSKYFLQFMNDGLERYRDDGRVASINGYVYPIKKKLAGPFFLRCADCWGWATWKRGWDLFEEDGRVLLQKIEEKKLIRKFDFNNQYGFYNMLQEQIVGKNNSWAIRWYASTFVADKLSLYPTRSLVHNIGNDSSGVHCGTSTVYDVILNDEKIVINDIPLEENLYVFKQFSNFFKEQKGASFVCRIRNRCEKLKNLLGLHD